MDRRVSALVAREVTVARDPIKIDRDKLRAAIRKLGNEYVFYMLDDAIDLLPPIKLHKIAKKYCRPRRPLEAAAFSMAQASGSAAERAVAPPPNTPASVEWNAPMGQLRVRYHGVVILDATVHAEAGTAAAEAEIKLDRTETKGEKVEQRLKLTLAKPKEGVRLVLRGTATASDEAFPAETSGAAQKRFPLVRNSVGLSRNLRNNALYDRRWDWLLSGPDDGTTRIQPKAVSQPDITFTWESRSPTIELVFRPRFYQKHRNLAQFEPWTYRTWKGPVTGYCTWWAYRGDFSQKTLDEIVDVFAAKKWTQIGDGTMDLVRLQDDFSGVVGVPQMLFKASDAKWVHGLNATGGFVTDAPFLYRAKSGRLRMTWSSFDVKKEYAVGIACSTSGRVAGPWKQMDEPLLANDGGHGMIFKTFDGRLVMAIHQPNEGKSRARLYEIDDAGDTLRILRELPFRTTE